MREAFVAASLASLRLVIATGPETGHPLPNDASVAAGTRALRIARDAGPTDLLVVLLSGGASAKMAVPAGRVTLDEKQATANLLLKGGADIHQLNTVRKHLSAIKGGQLAAGTRAKMMTLAISDVVGDDLSMIASGPTVPDPTTYAAALAVLDRHGARASFPAAVVAHLEEGAAGRIPETPKPGDERLSRSMARVIGSRVTAMDGARAAAEALGYRVHVVDEAVVGEARVAGAGLLRALDTHAAGCLIASGETTVRVTGPGRGGRNQEVALGMLDDLAAIGGVVAAASVGTDGIDGPTDAAGAIVDSTTAARAAAAGLDPMNFLDDNNAYAFFDGLGDLIRTGATGTNVGDVQIILRA
jgi:glycerate-2-kinase